MAKILIVGNAVLAFDIIERVIYNRDMLNEKRVKMMTKMAMEDKKNGGLPKIIGISRKEYIANRQFAAFLLGTLFYGVVFALLGIWLYISFQESITRLFIILFFIAVAAGYITFLYNVLRRTKLKSIRTYKEKRIRLERVKRDWDILEQLYNNKDGEKNER